MSKHLSWEVTDPAEYLPVSRTRAWVGWAPPVCPNPWKLGMGRDGNNNVADGSEWGGGR